jgi:hypothetical protein
VTDSENRGWRRSSFSDTGNCLEVMALGDGAVAVRNSNHTERGYLVFSGAELGAWIAACKAGELDDVV